MKGKALGPYLEKSGYLTVALRRDNRTVTRLVHRLVLFAWTGPPPEGHEARHLDGDRTNNEPPNLCWGSRKDNCFDRERHGKTARGERNGNSKLTVDKVRGIRRMRARGAKLAVIAATYGISQSLVSQVARRIVWKHVD